MSERVPSSFAFRPSVRTNSLAKLISNGTRLLVGLISAAITARVLGPADKGTLSTLLFVTVLITYGSSLGLGDAAVVLKGRGTASLQDAISSSLLPTFIVSLGGIGVLWIASFIGDWSAIYPAVAIASIAIPVAALGYVLIAFENARERLAITSLISALRTIVETASIVVLVVALNLEIFGGALAALAGEATSTAILLTTLKRSGYILRPRIDKRYLRLALRFGLVNEAAFLLVALSQRLDLILVFTLSDERTAGIYAIALTVGSVAQSAPGALTFAAFPRLAHLSNDEAQEMTSRVARLTLTITTAVAIVLGLGASRIIPLLFGTEFADSITPSILLLANAVPASFVLVLVKALSARGSPRIYFISFGANLVVMLALDAILIPRLGATGAAIGALAASVTALAVALASYVRRSDPGVIRTFIPTRGELEELRQFLMWITRMDRHQHRG